MKPIIEVVKHEKDFFEVHPQIMNSELDHFGTLALVDAYGLFFIEEETEPILFVRHGNPIGYRFGGFAKLSNSPTGVQTPLHDTDMAQSEANETFRLLNNNPWIYGYGSKQPFSEYKYYIENDIFTGVWKEGNFFDVKAKAFPYCIVQHMGNIANFAQIIQPAIVTGTYEGKKIEFLGSFDKVFMPSSNENDIGSTMDYTLVLDHGIREDNRKESFIVYMDNKGKSMGLYYLEGEEPVVSEDVIMEADWFHQPYSNDGTVMYKDAVFKVGCKTIHFEGRWGAKGITAKPRYQKHGQSQIFGTWYEGDTPYKHKLFTTFHENLEAYDTKFKNINRKIID